MNDDKIEIVHATSNLGIIFNSNLTWDNHINSLVEQTYIKLRALWSTQLYIPLKTRILIAKTYLIPCLLYGICYSSSKHKLNVLYNNNMFIIWEDMLIYLWQLRAFAQWPLLVFWIFVYFNFRIVYKRIPTYLFDRLRFFSVTP